MPDIDPKPWADALKKMLDEVETNGFWFRRLSDEEMAKVIAKKVDKDRNKWYPLKPCIATKKYWLDWLQEKKEK